MTFPTRMWHKGSLASRLIGSEAEANALGPDWSDKPPEPKKIIFPPPVHSARIVPGLPAKEHEATARPAEPEAPPEALAPEEHKGDAETAPVE